MGIFKVNLTKLFRCYADGEEGGENSDTVDTIDNDTGGESAYLGSMELNPDQKPLFMDTTGMSQGAVDQMLAEIGSEAFSDSEEDGGSKDEEDKNQDSSNKDSDESVEDDKDDKQDTDADGEGTDEKDGDGDNEEVEADPKKFYEASGLDEEKFQALPEDTQEKLLDMFLNSGTGEISQKIEEATSTYKKELEEYKQDYNTILQDPVIAARIKEHETGKAFVAGEYRGISLEEINKIDQLLESGDKRAAQELINNSLRNWSKEAVAIERTVLNQNIYEETLNNDVIGVFEQVGKLDKRLSNDGKDFRTHSSADVKEFSDFLAKNKIYKEQMRSLGADKVYKMFAAEKGWDKQRDENIRKSGAKEYLQKMRNPKRVAGTVGGGPVRNQGADADTVLGFDRKALVADLVDGNGTQFEAILERSQGDPKVMDVMRTVMDEARIEKRKRNEAARRI